MKRRQENDEATVGYEAQLWQIADALRGSMDAAKYKHVVLGLILLEHISDAFEEPAQHAPVTKCSWCELGPFLPVVAACARISRRGATVR